MNRSTCLFLFCDHILMLEGMLKIENVYMSYIYNFDNLKYFGFEVTDNNNFRNINQLFIY